jgi:hypothetical protein
MSYWPVQMRRGNGKPPATSEEEAPPGGETDAITGEAITGEAITGEDC